MHAQALRLSLLLEVVGVQFCRVAYVKIGVFLFFCDFQSEHAEIAPFFVHLTQK